jgi:hypothetical protein
LYYISKKLNKNTILKKFASGKSQKMAVIDEITKVFKSKPNVVLVKVKETMYVPRHTSDDEHIEVIFFNNTPGVKPTSKIYSRDNLRKMFTPIPEYPTKPFTCKDIKDQGLCILLDKECSWISADG